MLLSSSADFFPRLNFYTFLSLTLSDCQTVWGPLVGPALGPNCLQRSSDDE